jgi:peptide alpha-N-acetyltransferase
MRDLSGFVETRHRLLQLRSSNRNNWITFAVAHHLDGNHELCVQILSAYESTLVSHLSGSSTLSHRTQLAATSRLQSVTQA